jgi:hypothetical protein
MKYNTDPVIAIEEIDYNNVVRRGCNYFTYQDKCDLNYFDKHKEYETLAGGTCQSVQDEQRIRVAKPKKNKLLLLLEDV